MKKNLTVIIFTLFVVIVLGLIVIAIKQTSEKSKALEPFAQCIQESGAIFYGAFWCPHCNDQKALFGRSYKSLPYVECSEPSGNSQTEVCAEAEVESYPTWEFSDGTRQGGVLSLSMLATKTGCELPEGFESGTENSINNIVTVDTSVEVDAGSDTGEIEVKLETDLETEEVLIQ